MAKRKPVEELDEAELVSEVSEEQDPDEEAGELIPQDTLVCALTGGLKPDKPEERVLQSFIEQLHREYRVELPNMERDVKVSCVNEEGKKKTVTAAIAVYEHGKPHELDNIIRVVLIAKANAKQRPVFMAIAEDCGHGRRGETRYLREPDGSESLFEIEAPDRWERDGKIHERVRMRKGKRIADDLPLIAKEYGRLVAEGRFE